MSVITLSLSLSYSLRLSLHCMQLQTDTLKHNSSQLLSIYESNSQLSHLIFAKYYNNILFATHAHTHTLVIHHTAGICQFETRWFVHICYPFRFYAIMKSAQSQMWIEFCQVSIDIVWLGSIWVNINRFCSIGHTWSHIVRWMNEWLESNDCMYVYHIGTNGRLILRCHRTSIVLFCCVLFCLLCVIGYVPYGLTSIFSVIHMSTC